MEINGATRHGSQLSRETLELFQGLLSQMTMTVNHPDFDEMVARVVIAKRELAAALEEPNT